MKTGNGFIFLRLLFAVTGFFIIGGCLISSSWYFVEKPFLSFKDKFI